MNVFKLFGFIAVITVAVAQTPNNALQIANSGGNASSPLQYGLMFEVRMSKQLSFLLLT